MLEGKDKRSRAEKVRRRVTARLLEIGFQRTRTTFWTRPREVVIEFMHLHLFSFEPGFRAHLGIRVLNDPFDAAALNGPSSWEDGRRLAFEESEESLDRCSEEIEQFCRTVGESWFARWRDPRKLIGSRRSPLSEEARRGLERQLLGKADPGMVEASRAILGIH